MSKDGLRVALERTRRLICRSLDYPVREMSNMLLAEALKGIDAAIAMARDSAETACPAPVPQDCQARAESIAQSLEPKD